jgi:hypothetical protein
MTDEHHQYFDFLIAKSSQKMKIGLDPASEKFLEIVALQDFKGSNLTMMEALALSTTLSLSPNTLTRRIKLLKEMRLIEIHINDSDRRVKTLYPSKKASSYFSMLSQQMISVKSCGPN